MTTNCTTLNDLQTTRDQKGVFVIKMNIHKKKITKQQEKDEVLMIERMRKNKGRFELIRRDLMALMGNDFKKKNLLVLAKQISTQYKVPLDRLAKRVSNMLLCWYCEFWFVIQPIITSLHKANQCNYNKPKKNGQINEALELDFSAYSEWAFDDFPLT